MTQTLYKNRPAPTRLSPPRTAMPRRDRVAIPSPDIYPLAIVNFKRTVHHGLVLRQRPKWERELYDGGTPTPDNIRCWTYYVHVHQKDHLSGWYGASSFHVIHNSEDSEEAIARIREMPEVNPMLYNCILVRVIDQDGVWKIELMELPPDDPDREKYEKWWEHNRLPEFHDDDDDEGKLHLYTQPESL